MTKIKFLGSVDYNGRVYDKGIILEVDSEWVKRNLSYEPKLFEIIEETISKKEEPIIEEIVETPIPKPTVKKTYKK